MNEKIQNKIKVIGGVAFIIQWIIFQLSPFFEYLVFDGMEVISTIIMIIGMFILGSIKNKNK